MKEDGPCNWKPKTAEVTILRQTRLQVKNCNKRQSRWLYNEKGVNSSGGYKIIYAPKVFTRAYKCFHDLCLPLTPSLTSSPATLSPLSLHCSHNDLFAISQTCQPGSYLWAFSLAVYSAWCSHPTDISITHPHCFLIIAFPDDPTENCTPIPILVSFDLSLLLYFHARYLAPCSITI